MSQYNTNAPTSGSTQPTYIQLLSIVYTTLCQLHTDNTQCTNGWTTPRSNAPSDRTTPTCNMPKYEWLYSVQMNRNKLTDSCYMQYTNG